MTTTEQTYRLTKVPVAQTAMLICKPAAEVFAAFADPAITTRFWYTKSSGKPEPGASVRWEWEMYGVSTQVTVKEIMPDRRIVIDWDDDNPTTVTWEFAPQGDNTTFVTITNSGFQGEGDALVAHALDSVSGFSFVLAGAKALLEHGIELNLTGDRHPAGIATE